MQTTFDKLRWAFIAAFTVAIIAIWTYQIGWVWPRQRCEAQHRWWAARFHACATPVSTSMFTHRPIPGEAMPAIVPHGHPPAPAAAPPAR